MLVTIEGLDGAGKSSVLREVVGYLRSTVRRPLLQLGDISRSPTGHRLDLFRAEELSGEGTAGATALSRCLAAAADLFYFDGALIAPLVSTGGVVLKERHVDSLISHQGPVLVKRFGWSEQRAGAWLSELVDPLQVRPGLTIYLEAPRVHRESRLRERARGNDAVLDPKALEFDRTVFELRSAWYHRLRQEDPDRWVCIPNPDGELAAAVARVAGEIITRLRTRPAP